MIDHTGPWTPDDVRALPNTGNDARYEILAPGVLTITPLEDPDHQRLVRQLANLLENDIADTPGLEVLTTVTVKVPGDRLCVADIAVVNWTVPAGHMLSVVSVVEVSSPATVTVDRLVKPDLYAAAKVPLYYQVDKVQRPAGGHWLVVTRHWPSRDAEVDAASSSPGGLLAKKYAVELETLNEWPG